ncbi:MAG TPA: hypothetical protein PKD96_04065, partial [Candidatus Absconditabacterales bacterium]|nr:hypothetical protein [Candidatus Absconditabacterales bacterium]
MSPLSKNIAITMISSSKTNLKIFFSGFFSREQFLNIKFLAKIIGGSLLITILFGGFDYFFDTTRFLEAVHAQSGSTPPPETSTAQTIAEILDVVLKFVYMLMWPLLAIAGKSMDNSLIYGSIFHLDDSLR